MNHRNDLSFFLMMFEPQREKKPCCTHYTNSQANRSAVSLQMGMLCLFFCELWSTVISIDAKELGDAYADV